MSDHHIRNTCRLCGGPLVKFLDLGSTALANEYLEEPGPQDKFPLFLSQCGSCQHVQLPVVVNPERLFRNYAYTSGLTETFRRHLEEQAETLSALIPKGSQVLELASNDGTLLRYFRQLGHPVLGVDPARNLADEASRTGVPTIPEFWNFETSETVRARVGSPLLVVANNVAAHVDDLEGFFTSIANVLAPEGLLCFEVGYLVDVVEKGLLRVIYHEHLSYHHLTPLVSFLERLGLYMVDAERVDTQGGSIRVYARKRQSGRSLEKSDRLKALLEAEKGLDVTRLGDAVLRAREFGDRLRSLKQQGKRLAGYGAPAQLTTLSAIAGIDRKLISWVYDDSGHKINKVTPGAQIPIWPSNAIDLGPLVDVIVIFSANFADEIMAKPRHPPFKGEWIVA